MTSASSILECLDSGISGTGGVFLATQAGGYALNVLAMLPAGIILAVVVLESLAAARASHDMEPAVPPLLRALLIAAAAAGFILFGARVLADRALQPAVAAAMWPSLLVLFSALALWLKGLCRKHDLIVMPAGGGRRRSRGRRSAHASLLTGYRICLFFCFALAVMSAYSTSAPRPGYAGTGPEETPPAPAVTPTPAVLPVVPEPAPAAPPPDPALAANPDPPAPRPDESNPFVPPMAEPGPAPGSGSPSEPPAGAAPPPTVPVEPDPVTPEPGGRPATPAPENGAPGPGAPTPPKVAFASQVQPILRENCHKCHGDGKQKGDLRLDSPDAIRKGGKSGPVVVPGKPEDSPLYTLTILPGDDVDIMPPKGDPLTKSQTGLLRAWILGGAELGDGKPFAAGATVAGGPAGPKPSAGTAAPPPDEALMAKFKRARVLVRPVTPGSNFLEIDYSLAGLAEGKLHLELLEGFKDQVRTLDLSRTPVKDEELRHLLPLTGLTVLYLSRTGITDAGIKHLAGLTNLEYLNLYGTRITDEGLEGLQRLTNLRKLYLWKSGATPEGAGKLQSHLPGCQINMGQ